MAKNPRQVLDGLLKRKDELLAERNKPDPLTQIDGEIERVKGEIQTDAATERAQKLQAALPVLREKQMAVIGAVNALAEVLQAEAEAARDVIAFGGMRPRVNTIGLRGAVADFLKGARSVDPELLGLPPKPTAEEARRAELQNDIERARERIKTFEQLRDNRELRDSAREDAARRLKEAQWSLACAEADLAGRERPAHPFAREVFVSFTGAPIPGV